MAFTNPTDYPDFGAAYVSGSGTIFSANPAAIGTVGPFYIGNLPAFSINATFLTAGTIQVIQSDDPTGTGGAFPWGINTYNTVNATQIYDEIKVCAPYLFVAIPSAMSIQVAASFGSRGVPGVLNNNNLLSQSAISIAAGGNMSFTTGLVIPGPAVASAYFRNAGVPLLLIRDAPGGAITSALGTAVGNATGAGGSGCTFRFVATNNPMSVSLFNLGAALDATGSITLVSERGY